MSLYSLDPVAKYLRASQSNLAYTLQPVKSQAQKGNFFASPYSEYEERKKYFNDEYRSYMGQQGYAPKHNFNRTSEVPFNSRNFYQGNRIVKGLEFKTLESPAARYERPSQFRDREDYNPFLKPTELVRPTYQSLPIQSAKPYQPASSLRASQPAKPVQPPQQALDYTPVRPVNRSEELRSDASLKKFHHNLEPAEEYFPFGKPGAGAPYRDHIGKPIGDRKHFTDVAKTMLESPVRDKTSPQVRFLADERKAKDLQREELRRALDEQLEQKKIHEEEARVKKLTEDRLEQARIDRQLREIDNNLRKEIEQGEMSKTDEDPPPVYSIPQKRPLRKAEVYLEVPKRPIAGARTPISGVKTSPRSVAMGGYTKLDAFRLKTDIDIQTNSMKDLMERLKEEKRLAQDYTLHGMVEFEKIKASLNLEDYSQQPMPKPPLKKLPGSSLQSKTQEIQKWDDLELPQLSATERGRLGDSNKPPSERGGDYEAQPDEYAGVESDEAKQLLIGLDHVQHSLNLQLSFA